MMRKPIKIIASVFYLGYLPVASGTIGSLVGAAIYFLTKNSIAIYLTVTFCLIITGFIISGIAEEIFGEKDSKKIVIDEVSGSLLTFFLIPFNVINLIIGFLLYRLFDILKPYPIKKIENLQGSLGIMLDDIAAAVCANLLLHLIRKAAS